MRKLPLALTFVALGGAILASVLTHRSTRDEPPASPKSADANETYPLSPSLENVLLACEQLDDTSATHRELRRAALFLRRQTAYSDHWVRLGDALLQQTRTTLDFSQYANIELVYLEARRLDPKNTHALAGLAWAAGACHRFDDSIAWARLALAQDPDLPAAHGILGDAALELGRYAEAETHYQRMLDLKPDMGSYSRAAHLLSTQGNPKRAITLMRQALRAGGETAEHTAWCAAALAQLLCQEGAAPAALALISEQLPRAPQNPLLLSALGQAHAMLGDYPAAISTYENAAARAPQHHALAALHDLYLASGRTADATRMFDAVEALHRDLLAKKIQGGEGQLARFYADAGQKIDAAIGLAETEYAHHQTAIAADTLAWAYHRAGRHQDAAKLLPALLRIRVSDPAILYHAGLIAEANGQRADAQRHLYAALSRASRFNPVHAPLAEAALRRIGGAGTLATTVAP